MGLPCGVFSNQYGKDIAVIRTRQQWMMLAGLFVVLCALPFIPLIKGGIYFVSALCITIIAVQGLNIITGYCGLISLGHAAFMAVGAYTSGILAKQLGLPFWICLPLAGISAGAVGIIFGLPSVRVKGFYLALSTLAAQFIITYIIYTPASTLTGGIIAMPVPLARLGNIVFNTETEWYFIIMPMTVLMTFFAKNLARTNTGRVFVAVRDNDLAAEVMGTNIFRYKILAFFIGCFYAGIAGSLWAHYQGAISVDDFTLRNSIWYVGMLIVGGMGSAVGVIFGATFIRILELITNIAAPVIAHAIPLISFQIGASLTQIVFGLVLIVFLVLEPRGLAHGWEIFKSSYRLWPFSY